MPLSPGRLGVLGWPVAHSRSPAMMRAAFDALGLHGWSYQLLPVPPALFEETVRALPESGFAGANVTVPHKPAALALADSAGPGAREIGAANTLSFAADGAIAAENTDAPGMLAAIGVPLAGRRCLVLGAGGTARAAVWALRGAGASVAVWNRTAARATELAAEFDIEAVARPGPAEVLVNTTIVGMDEKMSRPDALTSLGLGTDSIRDCAYVVDFVYRNGPTPLVAAAQELGVAVVDGRSLLAAQGALSLERWAGVSPPRRIMEDAIRDM